MLYLHNKNMNTFKAATVTAPNLNSSSRWTSITKFIDEESIIFYNKKGPELISFQVPGQME
ncbi:MAG TPA: hypothetical protein VEF53_12255 [Patescibacteria group bacterium]|nr:hypothetical protein [Patescibacteria group bacterium]